MLDLFGHTALLVTSHTGAIPDCAFKGTEFIAVNPIIDVIRDGEMSLLVPICNELVKQPVNKFLQYIVYSTCIGMVEVISPAGYQVVESPHSFLFAYGEILPIEYLFCLFPEVLYSLSERITIFLETHEQGFKHLKGHPTYLKKKKMNRYIDYTIDGNGTFSTTITEKDHRGWLQEDEL